ncbi:hypothetical protein GF359_02810 [candidate division WOR-3 bacterium]|uniref:Metalloprotease TldD/E C-terminal domain-containing protein n=1 Tax=candidate division WOR-3 bacterium TaxID=2052148 RepID=A0A9D5QC41_UNCW3|nr:hypothetical protein [candidate division WOR-3 bacterium]MBD3364124.1 hypothetical protein [candidate division WOR-3 bacterium]
MKFVKALILSLIAVCISRASGENVILSAMQSELNRSMENLVMEEGERPYFISYWVYEYASFALEASMGCLTDQDDGHYRVLNVDVRVGDYEFDNSGGKEKKWWQLEDEDRKYRNMQVPIDDDTVALKHRLWLVTDHKYKKALEDYGNKKKEKALSVEDAEDTTPDFSKEEPEVYAGDEVSLSIDRNAWEQRIKNLSKLFTEYEDITISRVGFKARAKNNYFVNSEGSKIQKGNALYSIDIEVQSRSDDGMPLTDHLKFCSTDGDFDFPRIEAEIADMADRLTALKQAEECESYIGPVLIASPGSGAFVAEVLVPLLSASKKLWKDGGELKNKVGQRIMSASISVFDDPALDSYQRQALAGHYQFDNQGVAARRVDLVENGVLRGFLLSRSPVKGFEKSNGHGRTNGVQAGNLFVKSSSPQSFPQLKNRLMSECRKQGKSYGYMVTSALLPESSVSGVVFTSSGSDGGGRPAMSRFKPVEVYKVYTDGRQELERGMEVMAGSPLSMLSKIKALGNDPGVWTVDYGTASIVAPSILVSELEVRKASGGEQTQPILPAPGEAVE